MNQQTKNTEIVLMAVAISIFGGYSRAKEEDIVMAGGVAPKGDLLTKGGKHIFPLEKLAPFHLIKKALMRELSKFSVKSIGGALAFNIAYLVKAEQLIKDAQKEFAAELVTFRSNYDASLAAYIAAQANAGLADIIRQSAVTVDAAISRFGFKYDMQLPQPIGEGSSIESMVINLAGRVYEETAAAAYGIWDKSLMPSDSAGNRKLRSFGGKTKRPLVNCRDKLKSLAFLDGNNIQNAIDLIDDVLAETQPQGFIVDEPGNPAQTRFIKLIELMMDAQKFHSAATVSYSDLDAVDRLLGIAEKVVPNLFDDAFGEPEAVQVASSVDVGTLVVAASQIPAAHSAFSDFF